MKLFQSEKFGLAYPRLLSRTILLIATLNACNSESTSTTETNTTSDTSAQGGNGSSSATDSQSTSEGTGGTGGQNLTCEPGSTESCYTGADGTLGVGVCTAGIQTCDENGSGWGECEGEVTPVEETCPTSSDVDCDGNIPECPGNTVWAKRFGDDDVQGSHVVAVDSDNNVVIAGYFKSTINLGGETLTNTSWQSAYDPFLAKFDSNGNHLWSKSFGDDAAQDATGVAIDVLGNVYLIGSFYGTIDLGGGAITSKGNADVFLVKYDSDGTYVWGRQFGGLADDLPTHVAVDGSGNVAFIGTYQDSFKVGGTTLSYAGGTDIFAIRLATDGTLLWANGYGDSSSQYVSALAVDSDGVITMGGYFQGSLTFGDTTHESTDKFDMFVTRLQPDGEVSWGHMFGGDGNQFVAAIALDSVTSDIVVVGSFDNALVIEDDDTTLTEGKKDIFELVLDSSGNVVEKTTFGGFADDYVESVAVDSLGRIALAGQLWGTCDFGQGELQVTGGSDIFLALFDENHDILFSSVFGDANNQSAEAITLNSNSQVIMTGTFQGQMVLGDTSLISVGSSDAFVATFLF